MKNIVVGIDIGGTNTVFGIFDENGKCLSKNNIRTDSYDLFEDYFDKLKLEINLCLDSLSIDYKLCGIGIGAPNGNYYNGKIEFAPNLKWKGVVDISSKFNKAFNVPVVLTNDANATAYGEMLYGGAIGMKNFIVITLGTGVGSGIVVNGEVVFGHDGFAGEIGHTIVDPNGRTCGCGRKGCLETYASATGVKRTAIEFLNKNESVSLLKDFQVDEITAKDIFDAAKSGDKLALDIFEYTGKILGLKLSDAVAHTSPEAIFIYGGLANAGELIFKPTKYWMEHYLLNIYKNKVKLLPSKIADSNAAIIGAAALIWNELSK